MKLSYFERLRQFEFLEDSRYQQLNMRLPEIREEYDQLIKNIISNQPKRKDVKKEKPKMPSKKE